MAQKNIERTIIENVRTPVVKVEANWQAETVTLTFSIPVKVSLYIASARVVLIQYCKSRLA